MDTCIQCGQEAKCSVAAIMNKVDAEKLPNFSREDMLGSVPQNDSTTWVAFPICHPCHQNPTVKAHFSDRSDFFTALKNAGSSVIGSR